MIQTPIHFLIGYCLLLTGAGSNMTTEEVRNVVIEVPGITCVSRFTDSVRENVVGKIDGVAGCYFEYLPETPLVAKAAQNPISVEEMILSRKGRMVFQVNADFDDRVLIKQLSESLNYDTKNWVWIQRTRLSDFESD